MEDPQDPSVEDPKKQTAAQRGAVPSFWIPTSPEDWLNSSAKLTKQTINTLPAVLVGSGSVASQSQYLMMRAFSSVMEFDTRYALATRMKEFGFNKELIDKAAETLKGLGHICADGVALLQRTPSPLEWGFNRLLFHPQFALGGYKTFTDGAIRCRARPDHIFAILEVKKKARHTDYDEMIMQETCELVGWLLKSSSSIARFNGHSSMISQDHDGIFITFTPFNKAHQRYGPRRRGSGRGFLSMESIGPFKTNNDHDMAFFGLVILAAIEIAQNRALD
ncbi:hypothetical protein N7535_003390 [Penicillium sp. DV-2018c]|nr:hypothetical protein N7535_003390 [Penicillium sp. DV-2018c]